MLCFSISIPFTRLLPLDIDSWVAKHTQIHHGTATIFSFASVPGPQGEQTLTLTRTAGLPCSWSNPFATAATAAGGEPDLQQQQQQGVESEDSVDVVVQVYPDWSYCR
jgi:hypothetical protein